LTASSAITIVPRAGANGAVAQLGERDVRNVEVRGSIPLCSTSAKHEYQILSPR
jgi:hypothetical protein